MKHLGVHKQLSRVFIASIVLMTATALAYTRMSIFSEDQVRAAKETALAKVLTDQEGNPFISKDWVEEYLLFQNDAYLITYQKASDVFSIGISKPPFEKTRLEAEQKFLELIEAPESVACKLHVIIGASARTAPELSGNQFPLSFCNP